MSETALKVVAPQEFFREKISEALASQSLDVSPEVEFYLVNLLCEFISPGKLETVQGELDALETPLALMLKEAVEAPPSRQARIYKFLGDTSLYIAGFFQDYFNRKTFDIGYYIALGSSAYGNVSDLVREHGDADRHTAGVYRALARRFGSFVDVVAEVSEVPGAQRPVDVLAIYDRWTRSNSERLRRALSKVGIIPVPGSTRDRQ